MTVALSPDPEPGPASVPFHRADIDEQDIAAVVAVLRDGWLTTGERCREFEKRFAEHLGGGVQALAVNSCTSALHLALEALGIKRGDRVITSPYTFTATAEVLRYLGAHPVFADIDPATGNITADTVQEAWHRLTPAVRRRVRAVVPVHFAGLPCEMETLVELASRRGWSVVDDAAHALPAARHGKPIGTWGTATAFSFYATKTLCTGEGGMLVTADDAVAHRARVMRLHGIDRDSFARYRKADGWRYSVVAAGFKYNLTDVAAAMGITQLERLPELQRRRAAVAARYDEELGHLEGLRVPEAVPWGDEHAHHLYPLRVLAGRRVRDRFIEELAARGVMTSVHFIPLHLQPYYRDSYGLLPGDLPGATRLFDQEVSLPLFPGMTAGQVDQVLSAVPAALLAAGR
ncbi:MAG: pyridoxal phosphate-dependent aminotransferase [Frankiales bacterium]|nr:pyridoxal phosphate-dependent aminotransferase [Frankiales bacterium]